MHTFPYGQSKDSFGKDFLLHSTNVVIFDFVGDQRQTRYYFTTIFGLDAKFANYAMDFGKYLHFNKSFKIQIFFYFFIILAHNLAVKDGNRGYILICLDQRSIFRRLEQIRLDIFKRNLMLRNIN